MLKYLSVRVFLPLTVICHSSVFKIYNVNTYFHYCYGHINEDNDSEVSLFLCCHRCPNELRTHAVTKQVIYHISWEAFTAKGLHNM